ncbi:hypothetical protein Tco_0581588 [Tanacetum coccineum]
MVFPSPISKTYCLEEELGLEEIVSKEIKEELEDEFEEGEEEDDLGHEYFDKFPINDELAYHRELYIHYRLLSGRTCVVKFTDGVEQIAFQMPQKVEQFRLVPNLEKVCMQSVYIKSDIDKRKGVDCLSNEIFSYKTRK